MKTKTLIFSMLMLVATVSHVMAGPDTLKVLDTVSGPGQQAIQAAMPEFARRQLDVVDYQIEVLESDTALFVLLKDPNALQGQRGATSNKLGFEVEISKDTLQVIRANFVR